MVGKGYSTYLSGRGHGVKVLNWVGVLFIVDVLAQRNAYMGEN